MDIIEAVKLRKSIRNFVSRPVSREMLTGLLELALRSPSGLNAQTWEITVVTGEALDRIKQDNVRLLSSGVEGNPDVRDSILEGQYRRRQVDLAIQLFELMDIAREDKAKRAQWHERGYRFFDAPTAIILSADRSLDEWRVHFDAGLISQTICLLALSCGLGTCIHIQGVMFPHIIRQHAGIPDYKRIIMAISIGYPDWEFPANKLVSSREPVDSVVTWIGY